MINIKQRRRTLKNRGYAANCRTKRQTQTHQLTIDLQETVWELLSKAWERLKSLNMYRPGLKRAQQAEQKLSKAYEESVKAKEAYERHLNLLKKQVYFYSGDNTFKLFLERWKRSGSRSAEARDPRAGDWESASKRHQNGVGMRTGALNSPLHSERRAALPLPIFQQIHTHSAWDTHSIQRASEIDIFTFGDYLLYCM